jgi:hypothetical protein
LFAKPRFDVIDAPRKSPCAYDSPQRHFTPPNTASNSVGDLANPLKSLESLNSNILDRIKRPRRRGAWPDTVLLWRFSGTTHDCGRLLP